MLAKNRPKKVVNISYPNVLEISNFDAHAFYKQMIYTKNGKRKEVERYLEGIKDLLIQLGKNRYPSHFDFLTLEYGETENDEIGRVYVYVTRMDGNKGIVPEKLAEAAGVNPIKIVSVYEARTGERTPEGGYFFKTKNRNNDILIKYAVVVLGDRGEEWIKDLQGLQKLYRDISQAVKTIYSDPELARELRENCGYSRDGYL